MMNSQLKTLEEYRAAWLEAERELTMRGYPLEPAPHVPDAVVIDTNDLGCTGLPDWEPDDTSGSDDEP
jgi:hypothetical protein